MGKKVDRIKRFLALLCTVTMIAGLATPMSTYANGAAAPEENQFAGDAAAEQINDVTESGGNDSASDEAAKAFDDNGVTSDDVTGEAADDASEQGNEYVYDESQDIASESQDDTAVDIIQPIYPEDLQIYYTDEEIVGMPESEELQASVNINWAGVYSRTGSGEYAEPQSLTAGEEYWLATDFEFENATEAIVTWTISNDKNDSEIIREGNDLEFVPKYRGIYTIKCKVTVISDTGEEAANSEAEINKEVVDQLTASVDNETSEKRNNNNSYMYKDTVLITLNHASEDQGQYKVSVEITDGEKTETADLAPVDMGAGNEFRYTFESSNVHYKFVPEFVYDSEQENDVITADQEISITPDVYELSPITAMVVNAEDAKEGAEDQAVCNMKDEYELADNAAVINTIINLQDYSAYAAVEGNIDDISSVRDQIKSNEYQGNQLDIDPATGVVEFPRDKVGNYEYTVFLISCDDVNADLDSIEPLHISYSVREGLIVSINETSDPISKESDGNKNVFFPEGYFILSNPANTDDIGKVLLKTGECHYETAEIGTDIPIKVGTEGTSEGTEEQDKESLFSLEGERADFYYIKEIPQIEDLKGSILPKALKDGDNDYILDLTGADDNNLSSEKVSLKDSFELPAGNPLVELKIKDNINWKAVEKDKVIWFSGLTNDTEVFEVVGASESGEDDPASDGLFTYDAAKSLIRTTGFRVTEGKDQLVENLYIRKNGVYYGPFSLKYNYDASAPTLDGSLKATVTIADEVAEDKELEESDFESLAKDLTFTDEDAVIVRRGKKVTITASMSDGDGSGVSTHAGLCALRSPANSAEDLKQQTFSMQIEIENEQRGIGGRYYIYLKLADQAGNEEYRVVNKMLFIDSDAPIIDTEQSAVEFDENNSLAKVNLRISDTDSGLLKTEIRLYDGVTVSDKAVDKISRYCTFLKEETANEWWNDQAAIPADDGSDVDRNYQYEIELKDENGIPLYGSYLRLVVRMEDNAGNVSYYASEGTKFVLLDNIEANAEDQILIENIAEKTAFSVYNNPNVKISYENADVAIERENRNTKYYIYTALSDVKVEAANIPTADLEVSLTNESGKSVGNAQFKSSKYDTASHCYPYGNEGELTWNITSDNMYTMAVTVPGLEGNEIALIITDKNETIEQDSADNLVNRASKKTVKGITTYTDKFIRDTTAPVVRYSVTNKNESVKVEESESTVYYYGLTTSGKTEKAKEAKVSISITEKNWFDKDKPEIAIIKDGKMLDSGDNLFKKKIVKVSNWAKKDDVYTADISINAQGTGGIFHEADGRYAIAIDNAKDPKGKYYNYVNINDSVDPYRLEAVYAADSDVTDLKTVGIVIDTTHPIATYSVSPVKEEDQSSFSAKEFEKEKIAYYKQKFKEKLVVEDVNISSDNILVNFYSKGNTVTKDSKAVKKPEAPGAGEDSTYVYEWEHSDEGVYWITSEGTDFAGNKIEYKLEGSVLKIDEKQAAETNNNTKPAVFETGHKVLDMTEAKLSSESLLKIYDKHTKADLRLTIDDKCSGVYSGWAVLFDGITTKEGADDCITSYDSTEIESDKLKNRTLTENDTIRSEYDWKIASPGSYLRLYIELEDYAGNRSCYVYDPSKEKDSDKLVKINEKLAYSKNGKNTDIIAVIKDVTPFALYGNPQVDVNFEQKEDAISRVRTDALGKDEVDFIFTDRTGLDVTIDQMPVPDVKVLFKDPKNAYLLQIKSDGYVTKNHCFKYINATKRSAEEQNKDTGKYSFRADTPLASTGGVDGKYLFEMEMPVLIDNEVTVTWGAKDNNVEAVIKGDSGNAQTIELLQIENMTTVSGIFNGHKYTEKYIRDSVRPIAKYSIPEKYQPSNVENSYEYYYGLDKGIGEPLTAELDILIDEEYWYDRDVPEIVIYKDGKRIDASNYNFIQLKTWTNTGKIWPRAVQHEAKIQIIPGKADNHAADGHYKIYIENNNGIFYNYKEGDDGKGNISKGNYLDALFADGSVQNVTNTIDIIVDTVRPEAVYSVNVKDVKENYPGDPYAYYKTDFIETLTVRDTNLDVTKIIASSNQKARTDSAEPKATDAVRKTEPDTKKKTEYVYNWSRSEDKVYWITAQGTDLARNLLEFKGGTNALEKDRANAKAQNSKNSLERPAPVFETKHKVLDKTKPRVLYTITDTPDKCHYDKYDFYNKAFDVTFDVEEVNFIADRIALSSSFASDKIVSPGAKISKDKYRYLGSVSSDKSHEGHHRFTISGTDKAGNPIVVTRGGGTTDNDPQTSETSYTTGIKVLDITAPEYEVTLMSQPKSEENTDGTTAYYNTDVHVVFRVSDTNLDKDKIRTETASAAPADYSTAEPVWIPMTVGKSTVTFNGTADYSLSVPSSNNGVYRFEVKGEDAAGNALVQTAAESVKTSYNATVKHDVGEYWTYNKVIDTVAPTGHIDIGNYYSADLSATRILQVSKSAPYRQETSATGTISVTNDNSPVKIEYPLLSSVPSLSQNSNIRDYEYMASQNFGTEGQQVFKAAVTLTDRAGNTTEVIETNSIYLDVEAPVEDELAPTISIVANSNSSAHGPLNQPLFRSDVPFSIIVTDPNQPTDGSGSNGRSSGLDQVYYTIAVDGNVVKTESLRSDGKMDPDQKEWNGNYDDPSLFYAINTVRTAESGLNNNNIVITVYASDHSGNKSQREYAFGIDVTQPRISVTYDNNDVQNDKYFKSDRIATVVVTERNFDPSRINISTNGGSQSGWVYSNNGGNGDNDTWTMTITYSSDGDFTFGVTGSDLLGNEATNIAYNGVAVREFTVDKTAPVIKLTFDLEMGYKNSLYFNQTRTATVTITEHNFRSSDAKVEYPGTIARGEAGYATAGNWSDSGDDHHLEIVFDKDADYIVTAEYIDLAGNKAESVTSEKFTIDKTLPVIDYDHSTVTNGKAYSGSISPRIFFSDTNYTQDGVTFVLNSVKGNDGKSLELAQIVNDADGFGGSISYKNFDEIVANDDIYRAKGTIIDRAGNEKSVEFTFSVNRFGSTWDYNDDDQTEELVGAFTNKEEDIFLREINVNEVESHSVDLLHDTDYTTLKEGEDYELVDTSDDIGWKSYVYKFYAKNFRMEGKYTIVAHSKDKSGNENSNASMRIQKGVQEVPLTFTMDKTNPYAELRDVDTSVMRYNESSLAVNATVHDNLSGVRKVEIFIYPRNSQGGDPKRETAKYSYANEWHGEVYDDKLDQVLNANGGKIPFEIEEYSSPQTLQVVTYDGAGNVSTTIRADGQNVKGEILWDGVLVTRNVASQVFYNRPVFFGLVGAGILLALFFILFMKRRKEQEEENA